MGEGACSWRGKGGVAEDNATGRVATAWLGKRPNPLGSLRGAAKFSGMGQGSLEDGRRIRHSVEIPGQGSPGTVHPFKIGRCPELPGKSLPDVT